MARSLTDLAPIDPLGVPLPNGTEATTRALRVLSPRRHVPQGAIGRVMPPCPIVTLEEDEDA
jgi:hypothetical protein